MGHINISVQCDNVCGKGIGTNSVFWVTCDEWTYKRCSGGEMWATSVENVRRLEKAEMRILRVICSIILQDRFNNADVRNRFVIVFIGDCIRGRVHWFGRVERKQQDDYARRILTFEVAPWQAKGCEVGIGRHGCN